MSYPIIVSKVPKDLLPSDHQGGQFLSIGKELYQDYISIYNEYRSNINIEYLSNNELNDKLWYLFCEIYLNTNNYKSGEQINKKITSFISDLCKPINEYKIFLSIENLDETIGQINIWDFSILKFSSEEFDIRFDKSKALDVIKDKFVDVALMSFSESGNNYSLICERARAKARFNIKILQMYLRNSYILHDDQMLFSISDFILIENISNSEDVHWNFHHQRKPLKLGSIKAFEELFRLAEDHYLKLNDLAPRIANRVKRTIHWIGESIREENYDTKIIFLCTAMETLLTTKNDGKKGEKIAYRTLLLENRLSIPLSDPFSLLLIYELRSEVIHGSGLSISGRTEYYTMLNATKKIFNNYINFVHQNNIKKHSTFIKSLESKDDLEWLLTWFNNWKGHRNKKLIENFFRVINKSLSTNTQLEDKIII